MKAIAPTSSDAGTSLPIRMMLAWDRFWFTPASPTMLGVIRILAGILTVYIHFAYTYDLEEFFGRHAWMNLEAAEQLRREAPWPVPRPQWEEMPKFVEPTNDADRKYLFEWGFYPEQIHSKGNYYWSIYYYVPDPPWIYAVHYGILTIMVLFTLGFCTRITSVLTWMGTLSYIHRSPTTLFGVDTIMIVVLLYLMIGPSGAALSLDRLLGYSWRVWWARWRGQPIPPWQPPQPRVSANFALRLMQVHFCFIYMASGLSKLQGPTWWSGTAVHWTLANYEFSPLRLKVFRDALTWLCEHSALWELFITGSTIFTLVLEISFPFLVWSRRLRPLMVAGAFALHFGIAVSMGLVTFSLFMIALVLAFVPGERVEALLARARLNRLVTKLVSGVVSRTQGLAGIAGRAPALLPLPVPELERQAAKKVTAITPTATPARRK
jgi:hypothetical protein